MTKKIALSIFFILAFVSAYSLFFLNSGFQQPPSAGFVPLSTESFEQRRETVLNELSDSINAAVLEGKYHCCIDPPCTMCYLGGWIWDDGTCNCDAMIAAGEFDKVCPQCRRGIEEGKCSATKESECEIRLV